METPLATTDGHLGAHKQPSALLAKQAFEASKAAAPTDTIADFPQAKQKKQAPETSPPIDSSPVKQDKQASSSLENRVLSGNRASQLQGVQLQPEKLASVLGVDELPIKKRAPELNCTEPILLPEKTSGVIAEASNGCELLPSEIKRAQIDTAAPFESVKEAVTYFGERMDRHQVVDYERKTTPVVDTSKAYQEVGYYLELLSKEEASIAEVLQELEKVKEQIRMCKDQVPISLGNGEVSTPPNQPEEVSNVGIPQELYASVLRELEMARKEIENVYQERALLERSKQSAFKERESAFSALESASIRMKGLMTEQASSQEALAAAKASLAETKAEIDVLRMTSSVEGKSTNNGGASLHTSNTKLATLKSLDLNLSEADTLIKKLKEELATIRDVKAMPPSSVSNSEGDITTVRLRLEQAQAAEGDTVAAIGRILEELDVAKLNLSKVIQEGASLASAVGGLQEEVAKCQAELESARETEQIACATLASLQDELCSIRALVLSAHASEIKAREAKRTYPAEINRLASEADQAKAASKVAKEEARKGTRELEQAKAAMGTAVSRLQAAQKEAEAIRASEAMAIAEFTALSESKGDLADSKEGSEAGKVAVNISLEEYKALNDAGHGAERSASEKVAAALVQVEAAKASQQNAQAKLDATMNELEVLRKAMEEAEKKADAAQTAKLSAEADLRKWRAEHEQRRRTGSNPSSVSTSAAQSPRLNPKASSKGKIVPHSSQGQLAARGLDSLAEVLSLKLPPAEKVIQKSSAEKAIQKQPSAEKTIQKQLSAEKVIQKQPSAEKAIQKQPSAETAIQKLPEVNVSKNFEKAKKVSFFSRVMSILARKKSKSGRKVF